MFYEKIRKCNEFWVVVVSVNLRKSIRWLDMMK